MSLRLRDVPSKCTPIRFFQSRTRAAIVAFCRDIRGFSWLIERIFGIGKCGIRENSFGRGNLRIHVKLYHFVLDKIIPV